MDVIHTLVMHFWKLLLQKRKMLFFLACIKKDIKKQNEQMNLKTFKALFKETGKVTNF